MVLPRCPYCGELFAPSRYRPDQVVCSREECQRRRRTEYHRQKRQNDDSYYRQCLDSQRQWRDEHPHYMAEYRRAHQRVRPSTQPKRSSATHLERLMECVKNNVAVDLTHCRARLLMITDERVKNIVARAQLIIIEALPFHDGDSKEHPFGDS